MGVRFDGGEESDVVTVTIKNQALCHFSILGLVPLGWNEEGNFVQEVSVSRSKSAWVVEMNRD